MVAHSMVKVGCNDTTFFDKAARSLIDSKEHVSPQSLCMMLLAFGKIGYYNPSAMGVASELLTKGTSQTMEKKM